MGDLKVTFTAVELASIQRAAEGLGLTAEEFVRMAATTRVGPASPGDRTATARAILASQTRREGNPSTDLLRDMRDGR